MAKKKPTTSSENEESLEIEKYLWTDIKEGDHYAKKPEQYYDHLFEQYKMFVEMADRISARRSNANVFFLTINSSIITFISFYIKEIKKIDEPEFLIFPFIGVLMICLVWSAIIQSYKSLNSGKFQVIRLMSAKLPATPYQAEWIALGEGNDKRKYFPLTQIEQWVPAIFAFLYIVLFTYSKIKGG
ncbi:MAG: hypothetical protein AAF927_20355 [Bacteroidota bacterium]